MGALVLQAGKAFLRVSHIQWLLWSQKVVYSRHYISNEFLTSRLDSRDFNFSKYMGTKTSSSFCFILMGGRNTLALKNTAGRAEGMSRQQTAQWADLLQ